MIDIENKVIDVVITQVTAAFPGCLVSSEPFRAPSQFPCVSIEEKDNSVYRRSRTLDCTENHASVMYEINVYSNKDGEKKAEAKSILAVVDDTMTKLGFERTFSNPIPNEELTIYRIYARYAGIVSKGQVEGNKIIHKIYKA